MEEGDAEEKRRSSRWRTRRREKGEVMKVEEREEREGGMF